MALVTDEMVDIAADACLVAQALPRSVPMRAALEAVAPLIVREVQERIARELEVRGDPFSDGLTEEMAFERAAAIAREMTFEK